MCDHPSQCMGADPLCEHGEPICLWCDEVEKLQRRVASLEDQIGRASLIIEGGEVTLRCNRPIGYLDMRGGTLYYEHVNGEALKVDSAYVKGGKIGCLDQDENIRTSAR